ncbi:MAG: CopG family ribbon-helix-helix protein [Candidatus Nanohaloarchaea archaeon]
MTKVAVNIPDDEKNLVDRFVERLPGYKNRSDFIRKALRNEMERDYNTLEELVGSWSEEEAKKARDRVKKMNKQDIEAQKRDDSRH